MSAADVNGLIARQVHRLRAERKLSLEALAGRSGVSRAMISLIERAQTSPTAVVLEKLAAGLGVTLANLFEPVAARAEPVSRRDDQPVWQDPASGYLRRNVSPAGDPLQIVEVIFPAGGHVAYETAGREPLIHHQVWVLEGQIEVTVGEARHLLGSGDCLAFVLDQPTAYRNPAALPARYAVVITSHREPGRRADAA